MTMGIATYADIKMMNCENIYFVKSIRVETHWFNRRNFYVPMIRYPDGNSSGFTEAKHLLNEEGMPTNWGYETEDDAWAAIDVHIEKERFKEEVLKG